MTRGCRRWAAPLLVAIGVTAAAPAAPRGGDRIGPDVAQLVVAIAPSWDGSRGKLQCFDRRGGGPWERVFAAPVPVLFGRAGLAWGRGVLAGEGGVVKREGDGRAPAGVFRLGKIYGDPPSAPRGVRYPYHQVTRWDAWVDDPRNPHYNRHVRVDPRGPVPEWFEGQRMRLGDPAYHWLIEVRHNADPPVPDLGSAIFLHTRRGPDRPTAGCTVMARADLERVIRFLRAPKSPHYVLLPVSEYRKRQRAWGLPEWGH